MRFFYFYTVRFEVTILGCSSAIPTAERFPTSQLVNFYNKYYLLDCGEGTQIQLRKYKLSMQRISVIFISHAHADHFLGLPGLLSTMDLLGRQAELTIYAPGPVISFMQAFCQTTDTGFRYKIHYMETHPTQRAMLIDDDNLSVTAVPLKHSIPCSGFIFREKQVKRNIRKDQLKRYLLTVEDILRIKNGEDYTTEDGEVIPNEALTLPARKLRSYAFCTDTAYFDALADELTAIDLLYYEATFAENMKSRAKQTKHSTTLDAGKIAAKANVKKLIIGHYSVRYEDPTLLLNETKTVFADTELAYEGKVFTIG